MARRRKLFGAAAKSAARARSRSRSRSRGARRSRRSTARTIVRYVKAKAKRRGRRRAGKADVVGLLAKGAAVALGTWGAGKLVEKIPLQSEGLRAAALAGSGVALVLVAKPVADMARKVPGVKRVVSSGAVQLFGTALIGSGVARGWSAAGGMARLQQLNPFKRTPAPELPKGGTIALGPGRVRVPLMPRLARVAVR